MADKISENLFEERAATFGIPPKVLACPDDATGKANGVEHSGRARGLGPSACPTSVFGTCKHFANFVNSNSSQKDVEDLKQHVETLEEKLIDYADTKNNWLFFKTFSA